MGAEVPLSANVAGRYVVNFAAFDGGPIRGPIASMLEVLLSGVTRVGAKCSSGPGILSAGLAEEQRPILEMRACDGQDARATTRELHLIWGHFPATLPKRITVETENVCDAASKVASEFAGRREAWLALDEALRRKLRILRSSHAASHAPRRKLALDEAPRRKPRATPQAIDEALQAATRQASRHAAS